MEQTVRLAALSGSLRKGSYNTTLLNKAVELLPEGIRMEVVSIADIPLYNADLDLPAVRDRPTPVVRFRDALARAEGILLVLAGIQLLHSRRAVKRHRLGLLRRGLPAVA